MSGIKLFDGCYGKDRTGKVHGPITTRGGEVWGVGGVPDWYTHGYCLSDKEKCPEDIIEIVPTPRAESVEEKEAIVFDVGDEVEAFGLDGRVVQSCGGEVLAVFKSETGDVSLTFNSIGLLQYWHKEPSLKLVRKAKKKVTRYRYRVKYISCNRPEDTLQWYLNEEELIEPSNCAVKILKVIESDEFDE